MGRSAGRIAPCKFPTSPSPSPFYPPKATSERGWERFQNTAAVRDRTWHADLAHFPGSTGLQRMAAIQRCHQAVADDHEQVITPVMIDDRKTRSHRLSEMVSWV